MRYIIDGVEIEADRSTGNVSWMSDWTRCDELANAGLLTRKNYGPATYGHTDFFVPAGTPPAVCTLHEGCTAPLNSGHYCPSSAADTIAADYPGFSPWVVRSLSDTLPASAHGARAFVR